MERIQIMVPSSGTIFPDTFKCIWDLEMYRLASDGDYELNFDFSRMHTVDRSRNICVGKAMEAGADRLLFVDSDMTFDPEYLEMLLEHDEMFVMGYYDHRPGDPNADPVERTNLCKLGQVNYTDQIKVEEMEKVLDEGYELVQVKGGGLGFALIDMSVFQRVGYPYFNFVEYADGSCLSEDLFFAERCKQAGIPIYADTRCYCGHIFRFRHGGHPTVHED